jgi:transposase-like protein
MALPSASFALEDSMKLDDETKAKIIELGRDGVHPSAVAERFGVAKITVYKIWQKNQVKPREQLVTGARAIAKELGIHPATVRDWADKGILKAEKKGPTRCSALRATPGEIARVKRERSRASLLDGRIRAVI